MRQRVAVCASLCIFLLVLPIFGRQSQSNLANDSQAIAILQKSVASLGVLPADSTASGSLSITVGPDTMAGSIQIQTRGTGQSLEQQTTKEGTEQIVYSHGYASTTNSSAKKSMSSLELSSSSQSALFPLPLLSAVVSSQDTAYQYIQLETINGIDCNHIRTWNTFSSQPDMQYLSPFTLRDIWIDTTTNLPVKLGYSLRAGSGATPSFSVEVFYSGYKLVNGVQFPFQISESLNGTPWKNITISNVSINTGLTDSTFALQ